MILQNYKCIINSYEYPKRIYVVGYATAVAIIRPYTVVDIPVVKYSSSRVPPVVGLGTLRDHPDPSYFSSPHPYAGSGEVCWLRYDSKP